MLLAMDVGNTNIKLGLYDEDRLVRHLRVATRPLQTADEYGLLLRDLLSAHGIAPGDVKRAAIASVVPPLNNVLATCVQAQFHIDPVIATAGPALGLRLSGGAATGIDRLLGAAAAYHKYGGPVITCHLGTATTYNAVSHDGVFLGGAIAPGIGIAAEALFERTAKLPRIELVPAPGGPIGKNTVASMQAGLYYGFVDGVDAVIGRLRRELGAPDAPAVLTGGFASLISSASRTATEVDPFLTLSGLRLYVDRLSPRT